MILQGLIGWIQRYNTVGLEGSRDTTRLDWRDPVILLGWIGGIERYNTVGLEGSRDITRLDWSDPGILQGWIGWIQGYNTVGLVSSDITRLEGSNDFIRLKVSYNIRSEGSFFFSI